MNLSPKKSDLANHIKTIHEKIKKHKCEQCGEFFAKKSNLVDHINAIHSKSKNYECQVCGQSFPAKKNLTRHIKESHTNTSRSKQNCFQRFFDAVKYGPIFGCISCHIANYIRSVDVFDEKLKSQLEEKFDDQEIFAKLLDEAYYNTTVEGAQIKRYLNIDKDGIGKKEYYICKTCKNCFLKKKMPSRCILNQCKVSDQPDCMRNMSEVEVS